MQIVFERLDEFIQELDDVSDVRATLHKEPLEDAGGGVDTIYLRAGFIRDGMLHELTSLCGENWVGGNEKGTDEYEKQYDKLKSFCESKGVNLRGGEYRN